jgi:hypothetical protein
MSKGLEKEGDRGWIAGLLLVGLAALSLTLGLALPPPPSSNGLHASGAGPIERHATVASPVRRTP